MGMEYSDLKESMELIGGGQTQQPGSIKVVKDEK